jgi:hypothetical protein
VDLKGINNPTKLAQAKRLEVKAFHLLQNLEQIYKKNYLKKQVVSYRKVW